MEERNLDLARRLRRNKSGEQRDRTVGTRLTRFEEAELIKAADHKGKNVSEWARDVLLREARRSKEDVLLTETIATRMLLLNLIKPLAKGQKVTEEYVTELMATVRADKRKATQEVLQQYAEAKSRES